MSQNYASVAWQIYEANVQQYRLIGLTVQAFLITTSSIMLTMEGPDPLHYFASLVIILMGLIHLWFIHAPTVESRCRIVDYYKFQASGLPKEKESCSGRYVRNRSM